MRFGRGNSKSGSKALVTGKQTLRFLKRGARNVDSLGVERSGRGRMWPRRSVVADSETREFRRISFLLFTGT